MSKDDRYAKTINSDAAAAAAAASNTASQWQRRCADALGRARRWCERLVPQQYTTIIVANAALTTLTLMMLMNSVDRSIGLLPVSGTAMMTLTSVVMVALIGAVWLHNTVRRLLKERRRVTNKMHTASNDAKLQQAVKQAHPDAVAHASASRQHWLVRMLAVHLVGSNDGVGVRRAFLQRGAKVLFATACYTLASVLLRVVALLLFTGHFASGDMSALTLVLPSAVAFNVAARSLLLDPLRRRRRRHALEAARTSMTPMRYAKKLEKLSVEQHSDAQRGVALVVLFVATLLLYYPATADVPSFDGTVVLTFAIGLPVLLGAGALLAMGDLTFELYATNAGTANDRSLVLNVAIGMMFWNGIAWLCIDAPMGGHFFNGFNAVYTNEVLPQWWFGWAFGERSIWRVWLWFAVLCTLLAVTTMVHFVSIVASASSVPALFACGIGMGLSLLISAAAQQQPPMPSAPAAVYFACGFVLLAGALYIYRWSLSTSSLKKSSLSFAPDAVASVPSRAAAAATVAEKSSTTTTTAKSGNGPMSFAELLRTTPMNANEQRRARELNIQTETPPSPSSSSLSPSQATTTTTIVDTVQGRLSSIGSSARSVAESFTSWLENTGNGGDGDGGNDAAAAATAAHNVDFEDSSSESDSDVESYGGSTHKTSLSAAYGLPLVRPKQVSVTDIWNMITK